MQILFYGKDPYENLRNLIKYIQFAKILSSFTENKALRLFLMLKIRKILKSHFTCKRLEEEGREDFWISKKNFETWETFSSHLSSFLQFLFSQKMHQIL